MRKSDSLLGYNVLNIQSPLTCGLRHKKLITWPRRKSLMNHTSNQQQDLYHRYD